MKPDHKLFRKILFYTLKNKRGKNKKQIDELKNKIKLSKKELEKMKNIIKDNLKN